MKKIIIIFILTLFTTCSAPKIQYNEIEAEKILKAYTSSVDKQLYYKAYKLLDINLTQGTSVKKYKEAISKSYISKVLDRKRINFGHKISYITESDTKNTVLFYEVHFIVFLKNKTLVEKIRLKGLNDNYKIHKFQIFKAPQDYSYLEFIPNYTNKEIAEINKYVIDYLKK